MFELENLSSVQGEVDALLRKFQPTETLEPKDCTTPELRLEYIARWLEAGAPHVGDLIGFDMRNVSTRTSCGTICCIAGAVNQFFGNPLYKHSDDADDAVELLGMSDYDSDDLFEPENYFLGEDHYGNKYTPAWAARCIRKYQREGIVDWEGTREVTP